MRDLDLADVAGAAFAFVQGDLAYAADSGVRPEPRGHRLGRVLGSAVVVGCLQGGARLVRLAAEAGGAVERVRSGIGFGTAYTAVTYRWRE